MNSTWHSGLNFPSGWRWASPQRSSYFYSLAQPVTSEHNAFCPMVRPCCLNKPRSLKTHSPTITNPSQRAASAGWSHDFKNSSLLVFGVPTPLALWAWAAAEEPTFTLSPLTNPETNHSGIRKSVDCKSAMNKATGTTPVGARARWECPAKLSMSGLHKRFHGAAKI